MPNLPIDLVSFMLTLAAVTAIVLYLRESSLRKKIQSEGFKFLEEVKEKSWETLHHSFQKSDDILAQAELEGIKVLASSKLKSSKLDEEYLKKLTEALEHFKQNINTSQAQFLSLLQNMQEKNIELQEESKLLAEQKISALLEKVENRLTDFLIQTEQKTTSSIELELKATRQLIETYKNQQIKIIDENIIAIMEQTLALVLGQKLSLKDQLDLVYESLEKAKAEKFIV